MPYNSILMDTVIETTIFTKRADDNWTEEQRENFVSHIAESPKAGDVIKGTGGVRKIRWGSGGRGKRGGVRVIYFHRTEQGEIWLITMYAKSERETIPAHELKAIKEAIESNLD